MWLGSWILKEALWLVRMCGAFLASAFFSPLVLEFSRSATERKAASLSVFFAEFVAGSFLLLKWLLFDKLDAPVRYTPGS